MGDGVGLIRVAMLEEKARGLEGSISSTASLQSLQSTSIGREPMRLPPVRTFNPLFQSPAKAGPSRRRETHHETAVPDSSESGRASSSTAPREAQHEMAAGTPSEVDPASSALARREARHEMAAGTPSEGEPGSSSLTRREAQHERAPPISSQGQPSSSSSSNVIPPIPGRDDTGDTLVDVIGDFVDKQRSLAAKPPSGEAVNGDELVRYDMLCRGTVLILARCSTKRVSLYMKFGKHPMDHLSIPSLVQRYLSLDPTSLPSTWRTIIGPKKPKLGELHCAEGCSVKIPIVRRERIRSS